MSQKKFNAFISYSRKDGVEFVNRLRQKLAEDADGRQLKLWKDREQMEGDKDWWKQITEACDESEYLILVITPEALKSGVCQKEWRYAREQGICVRPVKGVSDDKIEYQLLPAGMRDAHIYDIEEEWRKFVNDLNKTCTTNRLVFMAPSLPGDYIERKEIIDFGKSQLLQKKDGKNIALSSALKGSGGFGKTTMAAAICNDEQIKEHYHSGIVWATIGEDGNLQRELTRNYRALTGDNKRVFLDDDEAAKSVADKLEQGKYLVVLDDVWNFEDIRPLVEKINNLKEIGLLITTRVDTVAQQAGSTECMVNEMNDEQAIQFFTSGWNVLPQHQNLIADILAAMGGWLILLKLVKSAAEMILKKGESLLQTLTDIKAIYVTEGLTAFDARNAKSRNEAVEKCMEASFRFLKMEERKKCLMLGIFPTDVEIPLETIYSLWNTDTLSGKRLLLLLDDYSLLNVHLDKKIVTFHDVYLHFYNQKLGEERRDTHKRLSDGWADAYCLPNDYAWNNYLRHLNEANERKKAVSFLQNFEWIEAKLFATGINELLKDYEHFELGDVPGLIYRSLRLSSHVLVIDKNQLAAQLLGRLEGVSRHPAIKDIINKAKTWNRDNTCWLKPLMPDLNAPGYLHQQFPVCKSHAFALAYDNNKLYSGHFSRYILVWDLRTGKVINSSMVHDGSVTKILVTKDMIVSLGAEGYIRFWDKETYIQKYKQIRLLTGSAHPNYLIHEGFLILSENDFIRIIEIESGKEMQNLSKRFGGLVSTLEMHHGKIICISKNGGDLKLLIPGGEKWCWLESPLEKEIIKNTLCLFDESIISQNDDFSFSGWNIHNGKQELPVFTGHNDRIWDLVVAENKFMTVAADQTFKIWDSVTAECLWSLTCESRLFFNHLQVFKDKIVCEHGKNFLFFSFAHPDKGITEIQAHTQNISAVSFTETYLVTASLDRKILIWNLNTETNNFSNIEGHKARISSLFYHKKNIVSSSYDGKVFLWQAELEKISFVEQRCHEQAIIKAWKCGNFICTTGVDKMIKLWKSNTKSLDFLDQLKSNAHQGNLPIQYKNFFLAPNDRNAKVIFSLVNEKIIEPFTYYTVDRLAKERFYKEKVFFAHKQYLRIFNLHKVDMNSPSSFDTSRDCNCDILDISCAKNKIFIACADMTIKIFAYPSLNEIGEFKTEHTGEVLTLKIHKNILISGDSNGSQFFWDIDNFKKLPYAFFTKSAVEFSVIINGILFCGLSGGMIKMFDIFKGEELANTISEYEHGQLFVTPHCLIEVRLPRMSTGGGDNYLKVWNKKTGRKLLTFISDAAFTNVLFKDGLLILGDAAGKMHFLQPMGFKL